MAWLAVDKKGAEFIYEWRPFREMAFGYWSTRPNFDEEGPEVKLPKGSIKKLIGKELTWEDEPFEYI